MPGFTARLNPTVSPYLWAAWLLFALYLTAEPFLWHVRYFESPGPQFYKLILVVLPVLAITVAVYRSLRRRGLWQYEPLLLSGLLLASGLVYEPLATLVILWIVTVCYAAGRFILDRLGIATRSHTEEIAISASVGLGLLSFALFLLGMVGAYYAWVFVLLLTVPSLAFRRQVRQFPNKLWGIYRVWRSDEKLGGTLIGVVMIFAALFLLFSIMLALAPSINMDMMLFHLGEVRHYANQHALEPVPRMAYSYYPQGGEILQTLGYVLAGQAAAQMVSPALFLLTLILAYALARRCEVDRAAAVAGLLAAGAIPFLHWTGSSFKNDFAMVLFQLGSLYCYLRGREEKHRRWLYIGVFLLASSFGVKHVAVFGAIPLGLLYLHASWRRPRFLVGLVAIGLLFGFYWHARTFLLTGNPLYPSSAGSAAEEVASMDGTRPPLWKLFLTYPWITHFDGTQTFESPSSNPCGIFLVLFVPMWLLMRRESRQKEERLCLLFVLIYLIYLGYVWMIIRYGINPFILLFIFTAARLFSFHQQSGKTVRLSIEAAMVYSMTFAMLMTMIIEINAPQLRYFASQIDRDQYLLEAARYYPSIHHLHTQVKPDSLVLSLDNAAQGYSPDPARFHFVSCHEGLPRAIPIAHDYLASQDYDFIVLPTYFTKRLPEILTEEYVAERSYEDEYFSVYRIKRQK